MISTLFINAPSKEHATFPEVTAHICHVSRPGVCLSLQKARRMQTPWGPPKEEGIRVYCLFAGLGGRLYSPRGPGTHRVQNGKKRPTSYCPTF